eukprot:2575116-Prymnesium_polylepis.1
MGHGVDRHVGEHDRAPVRHRARAGVEERAQPAEDGAGGRGEGRVAAALSRVLHGALGRRAQREGGRVVERDADGDDARRVAREHGGTASRRGRAREGRRVGVGAVGRAEQLEREAARRLGLVARMDAVRLVVAVVEADGHPDLRPAAREHVGLAEPDARDHGAVVESARQVVEAPVAEPRRELHPDKGQPRRTPRRAPCVDHRTEGAAVCRDGRVASPRGERREHGGARARGIRRVPPRRRRPV